MKKGKMQWWAKGAALAVAGGLLTAGLGGVLATGVEGALMAEGAMVAGLPGWASETAWAEENAGSSMVSMTISPMYQRIILTPGETYRGVAKVTNAADSPGPLNFSVSVGSFSIHGDENSEDDYEVVDTQAVSDYNQMMNWINIEEKSGVVQPNETQLVNFTITVPEDAPAGGQYATLLFQNDSTGASSGGNVNIESKFQVASIIYADVTGETRDEGEILSNVLPGFLLSSPLKATSMVENTGNVHTDATYILQVWPLGSDEEICTNEENPTEELVMPETKRYHIENCDLGIVGIYNAKQTVKIFGETSIVSHLVVVCPIWLMLIVLAAIVAVVVWLARRASSRRRMKRQD